MPAETAGLLGGGPPAVPESQPVQTSQCREL